MGLRHLSAGASPVPDEGWLRACSERGHAHRPLFGVGLYRPADGVLAAAGVGNDGLERRVRDVVSVGASRRSRLTRARSHEPDPAILAARTSAATRTA